MGRPTHDEEIRLIKRQLTQLLRALEQLPQHCREISGHPTGLCVDSYVTEKELIFKVDLPGVRVDDLRVTVSRERVVIEGTRTRPKSPPDQTFIIAERPFGPFRRELDLPAAVNTNQAEAFLQNGMLILRMPKVVEKRGQDREVPIQRVDE